jgi:methylenetetrahydrofolate reductase (NADPH)
MTAVGLGVRCCVQSYGTFRRMTAFCKTRVPQQMWDDLLPLKDDDEAVKNYGIQYITKMCRRVLESGVTPGVHFYTLNLEKSVRLILEVRPGPPPDSVPR